MLLTHDEHTIDELPQACFVRMLADCVSSVLIEKHQEVSLTENRPRAWKESENCGSNLIHLNTRFRLLEPKITENEIAQRILNLVGHFKFK